MLAGQVLLKIGCTPEQVRPIYTTPSNNPLFVQTPPKSRSTKKALKAQSVQNKQILTMIWPIGSIHHISDIRGIAKKNVQIITGFMSWVVFNYRQRLMKTEQRRSRTHQFVKRDQLFRIRNPSARLRLG